MFAIYYDSDTSETTESGNLELDPEVLNKKDVQHSSLEDIYEYQVFSSEFRDNIKSVNEKDEKETNKSFVKVLDGEKKDATDEIFTTVMSASKESIISNTYSREKENGESILYPIAFISLGMLLTFGVIMLIEKIKKKRKRIEKD